ncbi:MULTISPECIES: hypothetical protein [Nostoc]|uniref:Uncharacterized protein n=2 Tax=Nostoc TaxID=1177 RepID=A0ABR8I8Q5_9NOSO|nr:MULTISPECIES: hypothetical protein [Nostoc]MBD2563710.1 hypothetical protein [Nostoc linckia FACHB-391]MBD2647141.1 hypothetical protein [Nostoc foliaceum FACHB-393]
MADDLLKSTEIFVAIIHLCNILIINGFSQPEAIAAAILPSIIGIFHI